LSLASLRADDPLTDSLATHSSALPFALLDADEDSLESLDKRFQRHVSLFEEASQRSRFDRLVHRNDNGRGSSISPKRIEVFG
jgi:hypothetical protein